MIIFLFLKRPVGESTRKDMFFFYSEIKADKETQENKIGIHTAGHAQGRAMKKTGSPNFSGSLQVLSNSSLKNCIKLRFYHKCKHNERIVLLFINMRRARSLVDSTCSRILKSSSISSHYYFPPIFNIFKSSHIYFMHSHFYYPPNLLNNNHPIIPSVLNISRIFKNYCIS